MYNDTADAENDCGAQARESVFFNEFSDGSVALIDRDGDAGAWLSSDTTVAELEFEIEVQQ